jgi:hypothetical protein
MTSDLELSQEEISTAREAGWRVVHVTGTRLGSLTVLKLAFGNGETEVMSLNNTAIASLVAVLKAIAPKFDAIEALPIIVDPETGRITSPSDSE